MDTVVIWLMGRQVCHAAEVVCVPAARTCEAALFAREVCRGGTWPILARGKWCR